MTSAATHAGVARALEGRAPAAVDLPLDAIEMFRGFLTKVRHNAVRAEMPRTLRLLQQAGLEIEFFRAYAQEFAEIRGAAKAKRIAALAAALARFAETHEAARHVSRVAHHEMLAATAAPPSAPRARHLLAGTIAHFEHDPRKDDARGHACYLGYPGAIELEPAHVLLLSMLDGTRTLAQSARAAARETGADAAAVRAFYEEVLELGLAVLV